MIEGKKHFGIPFTPYRAIRPSADTILYLTDPVANPTQSDSDEHLARRDGGLALAEMGMYLLHLAQMHGKDLQSMRFIVPGSEAGNEEVVYFEDDQWKVGELEACDDAAEAVNWF